MSSSPSVTFAGAGSVRLHKPTQRWSLVSVPYADFEAAARIHRSCRAAGITPGGLIDCMIAAIAIRADAQLLAVDADFARMATVVPLRLR